MRFSGPGADAAAALWEDIARPARPGRIPGVGMAGFSGRAAGVVDMVAIPNPAVMLAIEFGEGRLAVEDATGREQRGSIVAGMAPGALRARARGFACVQVRMSPAAAHAVRQSASTLSVSAPNVSAWSVVRAPAATAFRLFHTPPNIT